MTFITYEHEVNMPYVTISATEGLSAEQKKQLLERSSDAVVQSIGAPLASVRVLLHDLPNGHYLNAGQFNTPGIMFVVDFIEGRTEEQRNALIAALSKVGLETTGIPESEVRVRLLDFPKANMGMAGGVSAKAMGR
ncbi:tautomerase family protein [Pusillimonas sp. SM2304]|uniref:tautomerase family protein n=1 Tax=Pusillimonas sp. SM2304 TaxID=3073241 RepID=UPI0028748AC0|nr:tautomerase family protein [Pusillimonas sp. SM2304]MDS1141074.1 tautomerase family protein [Pusillimonas sp. SM2304]